MVYVWRQASGAMGKIRPPSEPQGIQRAIKLTAVCIYLMLVIIVFFLH